MSDSTYGMPLKLFLKSLSKKEKETLENLSFTSTIKQYDEKSINEYEEFTVGFRRFNEGEAFLRYLYPSYHLSKNIIEQSMGIDYRIFFNYLIHRPHRYLKYITLNSMFEEIYAVFQLKENYKDFTDIEYYELCVSTNFTASQHSYFLFRFYVEDIETSCVLEQGESSFPYDISTSERKRPKIIISTYYKNLESIDRLFLSNYKREISKKFETNIDTIDDATINIIEMAII